MNSNTDQSMVESIECQQCELFKLESDIHFTNLKKVYENQLDINSNDLLNKLKNEVQEVSILKNEILRNRLDYERTIVDSQTNVYELELNLNTMKNKRKLYETNLNDLKNELDSSNLARSRTDEKTESLKLSLQETTEKLQKSDRLRINEGENQRATILALSAKLDEINSLKDEYLGELKKKTSEYEVLLNVHKDLNQTIDENKSLLIKIQYEKDSTEINNSKLISELDAFQNELRSIENQR